MCGIKKPRAFTVIELLVVIAIIAILLSLLIPALIAAKGAAKKAECAANMATWGRFLHTYASSHDGALPQLAGNDDLYYDRSIHMVEFFAENDIPPKVAYSPSNALMAQAYNSDSWISYDWKQTWLEPVQSSFEPGAIFIDNSGDTGPAGAEETFICDDDTPTPFALVTGNWCEDETDVYPNGNNTAHYSDSEGAKARWTFNLGGVRGWGNMQLEAYVKKGPEGHPAVTYEVDGTGDPETATEICLYNQNESHSWITIGAFRIDGSGTRTVSVEGVGTGGSGVTGGDIIWAEDTEDPGLVDDETPGKFEVRYPMRWSEVPGQFISPGSIGDEAHMLKPDSDNDEATWTVDIPDGYEGRLQLDVHVPSTGQCDDVLYKVAGQGGGTQTATLDQTTHVGWNTIGWFQFSQGERTITVTRNEGATGSLWADAIRLRGTLHLEDAGGSRVWADAVRLTGNWYGGGDEPTSGFQVLEGAWTAASGGYGGNHQYPKTDEDGTARAAWYFTVPETGEYWVYGQWPAGEDCASSAKFTVVGGEGAKGASANQQDTENNGKWRRLCSTTFTGGITGRVEITTAASSNRHVIADGIAVVLPKEEEFEGEVIGYLYLGYRAEPQGEMAEGKEFQLLYSIQQADDLGSVAILVDLFAPELEAWTTHDDGVHILYADGHVDWKSAHDTELRWTDTNYTEFYW